jgi:hypothetical protein
VKKSKKSEKIDLNFASLCFASKQKSLNRSEAKNLKWKKRKKALKKAKKSKKSEKSEKNEKKWKKAKKYTWIALRFVSLRSKNYQSEAKRKIWSEKKQKEEKKEKWNFIVK